MVKKKSTITKSSIIERILARRDQGKELSDLATRREDPSLEAAAQRLFGGWYVALDAAGIDAESYRKQKPFGFWTKQRIIENIRQLSMIGEDLHSVSMRKKHGDLFSVAGKTFHSWHLACEASGIPNEKYFSKTRTGFYTNEVIFKEILRLKEAGQDLSASRMVKSNPKLFAVATTRFKSWYRALKAAGINPGEYQRLAAKGYWTKERIIQNIREMVKRGENLAYTNASETHQDLVSAADNHYNSWATAVKEAGYDYDAYRKQHKRYTNQELLEYLRELRGQGFSIAFGTVRSIDASLTQCIVRRFGTYKGAIEAMGLDYTEIRKDKFEESFKGMVFEKYVKEAFTLLGWKFEYNKLYCFENEKCRPDFIDSSDGTWIDAKLDSSSEGVEKTIAKYLNYSNRILIVYLKGRRRVWPDGRVDFTPTSDYYEELRGKKDGEDLINNLEKLKKGILRPELQSELDRFIKKQLMKAL